MNKKTITARNMLLLALSGILLALSLSACGVTVKQGDNGLYDKKNDIRYINASTVYEATGQGKAYGKLQLTDEVSLDLFVIPNVDPKAYIATEDNNILYASTLKMPTLAEMAPTALHVCVDGSTAHQIMTITDAASIASLIQTYTAGSDLKNPSIRPQKTYRVRFESPTYPGFYYTLTYIEYAEDLELDGVSLGKYFLLSNFEGTFVPIDDTIRGHLNGTTGPELGTEAAS